MLAGSLMPLAQDSTSGPSRLSLDRLFPGLPDYRPSRRTVRKHGRSGSRRSGGVPQPAGSKLARMAAERRIGIGHPR